MCDVRCAIYEPIVSLNGIHLAMRQLRNETTAAAAATTKKSYKIDEEKKNCVDCKCSNGISGMNERDVGRIQTEPNEWDDGI